MVIWGEILSRFTQLHLCLRRPTEAVRQQSFTLLCPNTIIIVRGTIDRYFNFQEELRNLGFYVISPKVKVANVATNSKLKHGEETLRP